jgi:hypothetical protein
MPAQALAAVATLLSFAPHGNRIEFTLDHGSAELVWITNSTFRFRRTLEGPLGPAKSPGPEKVTVDADEIPGAVRIRSKYIEVTLQKHGLLVRVRKLDGTPLLNDLTEPVPDGGSVMWERQTPPGVRFYGLGPRADSAFDVHGKSLRAAVPFLIATGGYAEYHAGGGTHRFDFSAGGRYRITAPQVDYYFYYGPAPKEIFDEHNRVRPPESYWPASERFGSWMSLRASLLDLVQGAMTAMLLPAFNLAPYNNALPELQTRARQLGSLVPGAAPGTVGLSGFRKQLDTFFASYEPELRDRGFPVWHPLPFQFPDDPECARHADEFMLGDEMLIAPMYAPGDQRDLYLPQGIWTNLETNEVYQGRRTITEKTKSLPVFARNGTIVPLDSPGGMGLHYFPKLGAEFFLVESDSGEYSQVHAAPALDGMRLEIESKKDRDYQWVVHHVDKPAAVGEEQPYRQATAANSMPDRTWFYDAAQKNLHVRVKVKAGEDCVISLSFPAP